MDDLSKIIGEHEIRLKHMEEGQDELRADMKVLLALASEINGGKKVALAIAAAIGTVVGALVTWLLNK